MTREREVVMGTYSTPTEETITPAMIEFLGQTRPWVRFLSILGFVGTVFIVLAALFMMLMGGISGAMRNNPLGGSGGIVLGVVYLLMAFLYFFPSLFLFRYANGIASMDGDTVGGMERALEAQKSFWRFVGIAAAIYVILLISVVAIAVVVGVVGSAMR
jgi:hypothetical protein